MNPYKSFTLIFSVALIISGCGQSNQPASNKITEEEKRYSKGDLIKAIYDNDIETFGNLLTHGADVNESIGKTAQKEITPLLVAIVFGRDVMASLLLERGASTHASYQGYRAKDFSLFVLGDESMMTRHLRYDWYGSPIEPKPAQNLSVGGVQNENQ